jgi:hypothetical protein
MVTLLCASSACSAGAQKPAIETVMKDKRQRTESLEATLRVTDQHPQYVDELFALVLRHPATLERFLQNHSRGLSEDELSRTTAKHLAAHPPGLKQVMIANLDEVSDDPAAMGAVAEAMTARSQVAAMVITRRPEAVRALVTALIAEVQKNREARMAFVKALQENREPLARILAENPEVLASIVKALLAIGATEGKQKLEEAVD